MSEQDWQEFLAAEGLDDWVVLHGGTTASASRAAFGGPDPESGGRRDPPTRRLEGIAHDLGWTPHRAADPRPLGARVNPHRAGTGRLGRRARPCRSRASMFRPGSTRPLQRAAASSTSRRIRGTGRSPTAPATASAAPRGPTVRPSGDPRRWAIGAGAATAGLIGLAFWPRSRRRKPTDESGSVRRSYRYQRTPSHEERR